MGRQVADAVKLCSAVVCLTTYPLLLAPVSDMVVALIALCSPPSSPKPPPASNPAATNRLKGQYFPKWGGDLVPLELFAVRMGLILVSTCK